MLPRGPGPARDLSQHRDPLVGRLAALRIRPRAATPGAHRSGERTIAAGRKNSPRCTRPPAGRCDERNRESRALRRERQLVGRAVGPAHAVRARAQCDRGPAARRLPHGRWRMAVPEGAAGERRPHCQDPHRRMDAGADELAGRAHGHARKLLGPARRALRPCLWPARRRGESSPASRVRPPIITPPLTP